jgi:hypothetical protein
LEEGMKKALIIIFTLSLIVLVGCSSSDVDMSPYDSKIAALEEKVKELESQIESNNDSIELVSKSLEDYKITMPQIVDNDSQNELYLKALDTLKLIKGKKYEELSNIVHPQKGLLFSPYGLIDNENAIVLTQEKVKRLKENTQLFIWGYEYNSSEIIMMTFENYYHNYVYNYEYTKSRNIGINDIVGDNRTVDNIKEIFPQGEYVDFYLPAMTDDNKSWTSLRLVFEQFEGMYYLVGIVGDRG